MKVLVSGSHGLVGSKLIPFLKSEGHEVLVLTRCNPGTNEILWDPIAGYLDKAMLEGIDAVVHLAGENIASGRWTDEKKARIRQSRIKGTKLLCDTLAELKRPPQVIVSASAIGYYGNRGDEVLTEESAGGSGFLAELCRDWEDSTAAARARGIRVALLRIGIVLSPTGGALAKMLLPFQMGAGGKIGSGKQYMSWISIDDLISAINHVVINKQIEGPVNAVAPNPATNAHFTSTLGRVLRRPTILPMPKFAANMVLGEMADELLLSSARVEPRKLICSGFKFNHVDLQSGLQHLLSNA